MQLEDYATSGKEVAIIFDLAEASKTQERPNFKGMEKLHGDLEKVSENDEFEEEPPSDFY